MAFEIKQAKRELIWAKIALMSPSGGGKTYSSLRMATGMLEELAKLGLAQNGKILMGNTESSRGRYYANEFAYDIVDISSPHTPEMYVDFIKFAVENGYPVLILDSTSHEWEGKGGCLEIHQALGGDYKAWAKVTPRHNKFIEMIADSPIHILATMRGKDAYEIQKDEHNKLTIKKLGVGAKQREGFEYEFTATFLLDQQSNLAKAQKDNTHLFEDAGEVELSEQHGKEIIKWANSGEGYTVPIRNRATPDEEVKELQQKTIDLAKLLGGTKNKEMMEVLKSYEKSGNPNRITDKEQLENLLSELEKIQPLEEN